jgi:hypothetical protein
MASLQRDWAADAEESRLWGANNKQEEWQLDAEACRQSCEAVYTDFVSSRPSAPRTRCCRRWVDGMIATRWIA